MTETYFFPLFVVIGSIALWGNRTTQQSYCDLARAGLWDVSSRQFINTMLFGVSVCFLGILFSTVPINMFEGACYMFATGLIAASMRIVVLAQLHGVDSVMARMMVESYKSMTGLEAAVKADLGSEKHLQLYLDATYGRGKASAQDIIQQRKAREKAKADAAVIQ